MRPAVASHQSAITSLGVLGLNFDSASHTVTFTSMPSDRFKRRRRCSSDTSSICETMSDPSRRSIQQVATSPVQVTSSSARQTCADPRTGSSGVDCNVFPTIRHGGIASSGLNFPSSSFLRPSPLPSWSKSLGNPPSWMAMFNVPGASFAGQSSGASTKLFRPGITICWENAPWLLRTAPLNSSFRIGWSSDGLAMCCSVDAFAITPAVLLPNPLSSGSSSGMTLSAHFVNRVPFSLSFVLSHRLLASLLTVLPNSLDFLVSPQCRLPVRPRERRRHVSGVSHREAGPGNLLLISPRKVRDVAVLDANFVEGLRRWPGERRGRGLVEEDVQESILFRGE